VNVCTSHPLNAEAYKLSISGGIGDWTDDAREAVLPCRQNAGVEKRHFFQNQLDPLNPLTLNP
jgi:hypothetical protein